MRHGSGFYILSAFLFIVSTAGFAQDFTADAFNLRSGRENDVARIFVSGDKVRIEPTQQQGSPGTFVIWDTGGHHYFVVMPERRMYMDVASPMVQQQALAFWRPADVDNACPDWEKLAAQLKTKERLGSCRKIGSDTVNGRSAVKYEGSSSDGKTGNLWLLNHIKSVPVRPQ